MTKTLPISDVKNRLPELVRGVEEREEEVFVTRNGRPAAVLLSHAEYQRLKETVDVLSDPDLMAQVAASRSFFASGGRGASFEDVFGEPMVPTPRPRRPARKSIR